MPVPTISTEVCTTYDNFNYIYIYIVDVIMTNKTCTVIFYCLVCMQTCQTGLHILEF